MFEHPVWHVEWLGNTTLDYFMALAVLAGGIVILALVQKLVVRRVVGFVERTRTDIDNALLDMVRTLKPPFYVFIAFYISTRFIEVSGIGRKILDVILIAWVTFQVIHALQIFIEYVLHRKLSDRSRGEAKAIGNLVRVMSMIILWVLGLLFILQNSGVNITSLIAGLGIGGLAIGLAAKNIVEDLFSSLTIYMDKPFVPGDFIEVGDTKGRVVDVGVKTTTLKALDGEEIIVPNRQVAQSQIKNFGRLTERRVAFDLHVAYETPAEKLQQVPAMLEAMIAAKTGVRFGRAHVHEMGKEKITFQVVYHIDDKSYDTYMDVHQEVLLGIKEKLDQSGISLA